MAKPLATIRFPAFCLLLRLEYVLRHSVRSSLICRKAQHRRALKVRVCMLGVPLQRAHNSHSLAPHTSGVLAKLRFPVKRPCDLRAV